MSPEQGVRWHAGNQKMWIHTETRTWHDKNIQMLSTLVLNFFKYFNLLVGYNMWYLLFQLPLFWRYQCESELLQKPFNNFAIELQVLLQYKVLFTTKHSKLMSRNYLYEHHRHNIQKSEAQNSQLAPVIPRWHLGTGTPKNATGTQDSSKSFVEFYS